MGDVGRKVPAHVFQAVDTAHISHDDQGSDRVFLGIEQRGNPGAQLFFLEALINGHFFLDSLVIFQDHGHQLLDLLVTDQAGEELTGHLAGIQVEQGGGGPVDSYDLLLGVNGNNRIGHGAENSFQFIVFARYCLDFSLDLGRHGVKRSGEASHLRRYPVITDIKGFHQHALGQLFRIFLQARNGKTDTSGNNVGCDGGNENNRDDGKKYFLANSADCLVNGTDRQRQAQDRFSALLVLVDRQSNVEPVVSQGLAEPYAGPDLSRQGGLHLRAIAVVIHSCRVIIGVCQHQSVGGDDGDSGACLAAYPAAKGLQLMRLLFQQPVDFRLQEQGPGLHIPGHLLIIKSFYRRSPIPGDQAHRGQGDKQDGWEYVPEQADVLHPLIPSSDSRHRGQSRCSGRWSPVFYAARRSGHQWPAG